MSGIDVVRRGVSGGATCVAYALFAPVIALTSIVEPLRKIALAVVLLDIPLQIDTNLSHLDDAAELGAVGGFDVSVTTFALATLYALWLIEALSRTQRPHPIFKLIMPLGTYVLIAALSVVAAQDVGLYARGMFLLLQLFLLFVYLVAWIRTREDVCFVATLLLCGLALESLIIIASSQTRENIAVVGTTVRVEASAAEGARFSGTLGSPISAAAFLALLLAPAVGLLASNLGRLYKIVAAVALGLGSVALIGTLSRAAWAGAVFSILMTCLAFKHRGRVRLALPLLVVALVVMVGLGFQDTIATRLTGDDRGSARQRVPLALMALEIIGDNPVLGVGINNYTVALRSYGSTVSIDALYTVHNRYLLVWAETGPAGLAAFLWFMAATVRLGWRQWKRRDPFLSPLALGFTTALVGQMAHMCVDVFNTRPQIQLQWVVAALLIAMTRIASHEDTIPPVRAHA